MRTLILSHHDIRDLEHKHAPLLHHKLGLQFTASGYGRRMPTEYMVKLPGSKRWRRVYVCCFSNAGTAYVEQGKDWIVITGQV